MKSEVKVNLLGFMPFETTLFESFFKLVGRGNTFYKIIPDVAQADVVIINSDNANAVQWAGESVASPQKALFIGAADPMCKWPAAPKPVKLTTVLGLLDLLTMAGKRVAADAAPATVKTAATAVPVQTRPASALATKLAAQTGSVRQGTGTDGSSGLMASSFLGLGDAPIPISSAQKYDDILVVDTSDTALKFMQSRLARYGFRTALVKNGEEALVRIAAESYKFVFLEVTMEGLDGYQICRAIKQLKYATDKAPVVVMLSSRGGTADKIRGGLAGCDAYLTKPLNEAELLRILSRFDDQVERSFRDTTQRTSGMSAQHSR